MGTKKKKATKLSPAAQKAKELGVELGKKAGSKQRAKIACENISEETMEFIRSETAALRKKRHKELSTPEKTQLALVEGTLAKVKEAARREGLSQSSWMRRVINIALVQHENIFGPLE